MKKQYVSIFIIILSVSTFLFSCSSKMNKKMGDLHFDNIKINETAHLFSNDEKPACNINIDFTYPDKASDELLKDTLNYYFIQACFGDKYLSQSPKEAVSKYAANYIKEYRSDLEPLYLQDEKEIADGNTIGAWYSYYKNIESSIQFYEKDLLVYRSHYEEYTGGAHGMYFTQFLNIDLGLMRPLTLEDIFIGEYKEPLTNILWSQLMAKQKVKSREALEDMGYCSTGELTPIENFYLDSKGITFYYNVYEITPYAMGPVEISVPYEMIQHWLNNNPVIQELAK